MNYLKLKSVTKTRQDYWICSGPYEYFRPYVYSPDHMGIYLCGPTVRRGSGSFVKHLKIILYIFANDENKR